MKKKLCLLLSSLMIFSFVGCGSSGDEPKKVGSSGEANQEESKAESNAPTIFNVGDVIEVDGYKIVVNSTRTTTQDSSGYFKADEGMEYFLTSITLENVSDEEKSISSMMMFKVVDQDGKAYDQSLFTDAEGSLDGSIAPTRKMTGEYAVEVPIGTTGLELEFADFGSKQVIVKLN